MEAKGVAVWKRDLLTQLESYARVPAFRAAAFLTKSAIELFEFSSEVYARLDINPYERRTLSNVTIRCEDRIYQLDLLVDSEATQLELEFKAIRNSVVYFNIYETGRPSDVLNVLRSAL